MNRLTKRLKIISQLVTGKVVADVGCDHGKLAKKLLDDQKVDFVYISDISAPSLKKAEILLSSFSNVKSICCDGLSGFKDEYVDECVISGMGGEEIIKIISKSPIEINSYILSPQHNNVKLKEFLIQNSYEINYDIIIQDKSKFYNIIRCQKTTTNKDYQIFDLYFGRQNFEMENLDFNNFLIYEYHKTKQIIDTTNAINKEKYLELLIKAMDKKGIKL